jgi:hypothetical protein
MGFLRIGMTTGDLAKLKHLPCQKGGVTLPSWQGNKDSVTTLL